MFQVRIEDEHTSRHDVEYESPLNGPKPNTIAGCSDGAGENDEDAESDDSRSHDDHEPEGSEYDDDDDESEEEDGEDDEPALKYERMGGAAQEFFESGRDSASALCVGKDSFVSSVVPETIAASSPMYRTRPLLAPLAGVSFGPRLLPFHICKEGGCRLPEILLPRDLIDYSSSFDLAWH